MWLGPSLEGMPENIPELLFLKQACLKYSFRSYLAYRSSGTRGTLTAGTFRHSDIKLLVRNSHNQGKGGKVVSVHTWKMLELPF